MIAAGAVRPALVGAQIVATFLAANVAGGFAAVNYQSQQVQSAKASIDSASSAFDAQVARSVDEGTPRTALDPLVQQKAALQGQAMPTAAFIIDRQMVAALQQRASAVKSLTAQVQNAETASLQALQLQLVDALKALATDIKSAQDAGVDITAFQKFADDTGTANQQVTTPRAAQSALDSVLAKDGEIKAALASKIAANQALLGAQADAHNAVSSAQAALAKAQAIPVLKLSDSPSAIAALADRLTHAAAVADFQDIAAKAWAQSSALNALLSTRQSAYDLLAATRHEIGLAQGAGKDVSADSAALDGAGKQLDAAGDLPSLKAAKAAIQAIKSAVDAKYWQAIYGAGKVIVTSILREELIALDNGAVVVDTPVTTGRPALPTITGVYHIFRKESPYTMHSDWPPSSPYYFPPTKMNWAMEWESSGYFIHDAPWRHRYGPGTNGDNGTHGCINVPHDPMSVLYGWAEIGTTVVVLQGDFGSSP